jgi:hypothetical protein
MPQRRDRPEREPPPGGGYSHEERYTRDLHQDDEPVAERPPRRAEEGPPERPDRPRPRRGERE